MTRFFVPSQGDIEKWTAKEMRYHDDFVFLDLAATYKTIGVQTVRPAGSGAWLLYSRAWVSKSQEDRTSQRGAFVADTHALRLSSAPAPRPGAQTVLLSPARDTDGISKLRLAVLSCRLPTSDLNTPAPPWCAKP